MTRLPSWPYHSDKELAAVVDVLRSGKTNYWTGNKCKEFEKDFADYVGSTHAISVANGSLALSLAYLALALGSGDEVITTPRTFLATSSSIALLKATPVFADVSLDSGNIDPQDIERRITKKTKAIVVVHLAGWPAEMAKIQELAKAHDLFLIEDCAQAHGARIDGQSVGSFGDISCWSFCQDKIMTTGGEGGMVCTSSKEMWSKMWSFKDHGKSYLSVTAPKVDNSFRWLHDSFGSNFRLTEMQSALGIEQLKMLDTWRLSRERNAMMLYDQIKDINALRIPIPPPGITHAWYKFYAYIAPSSLKSDWTRDRIVNEILSEGYPAFSGSCSEIYLEKCFNDLEHIRLPNARQLGESSLMFLVHPTITDEDMNSYASTVRSVLIRAIR